MSFPTVTLPGLEMLFIRIDFMHRHFTISLFTIGNDDALLTIKLHMLYIHGVSNQIFPILTLNPIRSGHFSHSSGLGAQRPGCQKHGYHQLIEMKLSISQYSHENMSDVKFESGSFSSFEDMASQNFLLKRETSHKIRIFIPGKWI